MSDRLLILLILAVVPVSFLLARDAISPFESEEAPTVLGPLLIEQQEHGAQIDQPDFVTVGSQTASDLTVSEPDDTEDTPNAPTLAGEAASSEATGVAPSTQSVAEGGRDAVGAVETRVASPPTFVQAPSDASTVNTPYADPPAADRRDAYPVPYAGANSEPPIQVEPPAAYAQQRQLLPPVAASPGRKPPGPQPQGPKPYVDEPVVREPGSAPGDPTAIVQQPSATKDPNGSTAQTASSRDSFRRLVDFAESRFDWSAQEESTVAGQAETPAESAGAPARPPEPLTLSEPVVQDELPPRDELPTGDGDPRGELATSTPPGVPRELPNLPLPEPANSASPDSMQISIGSGAIKLQAPGDWFAYEAPVGRELRLVLSPKRITSLRELPDDAFWLSYQVRQREPSLDDAKLQSMILARMKSATKGRGNEGSLMPLNVGGSTGVLLPFQIADSEGQHGGFHALLRTAWGICEVHGIAPYEVYEARRPTFERLLSSLEFGGLKSPKEPAAKVRDAGPILGSWKAVRSQFRLYPDGRIELATDPKELLAIDEQAADDVERLAGGFEANGDLMYVVWADGSRLNFRWRLVGDRLLLTDHEGRISELRRMLD